MVSRLGPGRAISEALCPDCAFPCNQAPGRGLQVPAQTPPQPGGGVARAHLPSWATLHSAPQAGGGLRPTPPGRQCNGKAHSARRGSRRLRLSVRRRARMRPSAKSRAGGGPWVSAAEHRFLGRETVRVCVQWAKKALGSQAKSFPVKRASWVMRLACSASGQSAESQLGFGP